LYKKGKAIAFPFLYASFYLLLYYEKGQLFNCMREKPTVSDHGSRFMDGFRIKRF